MTKEEDVSDHTYSKHNSGTMGFGSVVCGAILPPSLASIEDTLLLHGDCRGESLGELPAE